VQVQLAWSPEDEAFRVDLIAFLDENTPEQMLTGYDFQDVGDEHELVPQWLRDWQATLFDHGWMIPGYPPERGGRNCTPVQTLIYLETMAGRRLIRSGHFPGYAIVAPSLLEFGNDEQKQLVPAAIRGDTIWCIGMSEPNAGSDLAGLSTRAELRDDHFVVNGQKVWTSYAMIAQKCFCYVRTDPTLPKHKGISLLIIDVDSPGIDIRPLRHISGTAGFAEVFFTDVIVPRENLVGGLNGGWAITQGSLAHERASSKPSKDSSNSRVNRAGPAIRSFAARSHPPTSWPRRCARSATRVSRRSPRDRARRSTAT
jgi:alkylation response protein AidB-like acyl-CoA dehydrogenase